ncbi:hypothetical protein F5Y08DRAFT_307599 [Xylaria arbuscula]|nr:hypothetical protein F5Y08DRAFT_307599 [Xylaria arbuscula]
MQSTPIALNLAVGDTRQEGITTPGILPTALPSSYSHSLRLNASFLKHNTNGLGDIPVNSRFCSTIWREVTEWENPVWGWVLINFVNRGIQLFLQDGTFYHEMRFSSQSGAPKSPTWLPFSSDGEAARTSECYQLHALARKLSDPRYFEGFWYMITRAEESSAEAPSVLAQSLNSAVGRPFALVNMGWSLELGDPPAVSRMINSEGAELDPVSATESQKQYDKVPVRLGSGNCLRDGLIGYFETSDTASGELNLDCIRTFFAPKDKDMVPLKLLTANEHVHFSPFQGSPCSSTIPSIDHDHKRELVDSRSESMSIFAAIIDPFIPVRSYSSKLPQWTWEKALNGITSYVHLGPLLVPVSGVPSYAEDLVGLAKGNTGDTPRQNLVPSFSGNSDSEWNWLQPYVVKEGNAISAVNPAETENQDDSTESLFQNGQQTAIEGYMSSRNSAGAS